ncbi:metal-dependent hydrolase [Alienimonas sp. DA493]|uniref:metal-dependent hydrolase n=1 Tax=Alienimonas sp. DA493 TaxID=3373605 RepID=UPI0037547A8A
MFREHVAVSGTCGAALAAGMWIATPIDGVQAGVAFTLVAVGGTLPDLDSDRGKPIQELTALLGAAVPFVLVRRFAEVARSFDAIVGLGILTYLAVRYGGGWLLRKLTVHRGMFHSLPAMMISGLLTYLAYKSPEPGIRLLMATAVMTGFASHLVLDEWCSIDWRGLTPRLKSSAGTAIKWAGDRPAGTVACYALLAVSFYAVLIDGDLIEVNRVGVPQRVADQPREPGPWMAVSPETGERAPVEDQEEGFGDDPVRTVERSGAIVIR